MTVRIEADQDSGEEIPQEDEEGQTPPVVQPTTEADGAAQGRAARAEAPRSSHSMLDASSDRDPVGLLEDQAASRVPELVPIHFGRMLASPFTFYRGAAVIMAHDLASTPRAGLSAQLCGDAHLSNFGGFASPDRTLVFSVNDFDETLPGPFEWDVKRLAASFEIAGRERGFSDAERRTAVLRGLRAYRKAMRNFARMNQLDVWYSRLDAEAITAQLQAEVSTRKAKAAEKDMAKARTKDSLKAFAKLTRIVDGKPRIVSEPPLIVPIRELVADAAGRDFEEKIRNLMQVYRRSLQYDRRILLEDYRYVDMARKVVGVGSVGTRDFVILLLGRNEGDPLFLQVKEAQASVLESHLGRSEFRNHGRRVVEGQRMMQAASDIFLGWVHDPGEGDGVALDYYIRQLWDWKTSVNLESLSPHGLELYGKACGWSLARAHARSGDRIAIAAYLGKSDVFDRAVADFAVAYADLNKRDHAALREAVDSGRIKADTGK